MQSRFSAAPQGVRNLHARYWGKPLAEVISIHVVSRDTNPVNHPDIPNTCEVFISDPHFAGAVGSHALVREEYKVAEAFLENVDDEVVVFTGSPGIGKSMLLLYLLAKKLSQKQPVLLQFRSRLVFFHADGAFVIREDQEASDMEDVAPLGTWALIDVDQTFERPAGPLKFMSQWKLVVAASARKAHWDWAKRIGATRTVFLKPWSLEEIVMARSLQKKQGPTERQLRSFFDTFGPIARPAFMYAHKPAQHIVDLKDPVQSLSVDHVQRALTSLDIPLDPVSHKALLVLPDGQDRIDSRSVIMSPFIADMLIDRSEDDDAVRVRQLSRLLGSNPDTSASSGWLFESVLHRALRREGVWKMWVLTPGRPGPKNVTYRLVRESKTRILTLTDRLKTFFHSAEKVIQNGLDSTRYYQPNYRSYPMLDSFVISTDISGATIFTMFQVTIGSKHTVNAAELNRILDAFAGEVSETERLEGDEPSDEDEEGGVIEPGQERPTRDAHKKVNVTFQLVMCIPNSQSIEVPVPREFAPRLTVFVVHVDLDQALALAYGTEESKSTVPNRQPRSLSPDERPATVATRSAALYSRGRGFVADSSGADALAVTQRPSTRAAQVEASANSWIDSKTTTGQQARRREKPKRSRKS